MRYGEFFLPLQTKMILTIVGFQVEYTPSGSGDGALEVSARHCRF